ncbi:TPA: restriction endonuclease subunit S [Vibrio cholerae]|nr:restriction endonuclease subunit S [Vibrio cholerae]HDB1450561.1 restriction endonuclease subunit S [Vibrio cholerae]
MKEQAIQSPELHKNTPRGFVQTEVGVIPNDWVVKSIGETITLINGYGFKPYQWKREGLPIVRIQNLNDDNASFNYYEGTVDAKFYIDNGDLVFAWSGSKGSSFGARIWRGNKAILNQHIFKVIPNNDFLNDDFCYLILRSVQEDIENKAHGFKSSFVHVKKGDLENTLLPIPPLNEQTAIANALSDVDALIQELEKLIVKKQAIKTATMQQLLTGRTRLPQFAHHPDGRKKGYKPSELGEIPEDWEVIGFGSLFQPTVSKKAIKPNSLVSFVGMQDVTEQAQLSSQHLVTIENVKSGFTYFERGDVLVAKITPCFENGKGCHTESLQTEIGFGSTEFHVLRATENSDAKFIYYWSNRDIFRRELESEMVGSAGHRRVPLSAIAHYLIPVPQKEEQTAIANILSDMDAEAQALEQRLNKTRQIKQGMMQELLTGKTRLVKPAGAAE